MRKYKIESREEKDVMKKVLNVSTIIMAIIGILASFWFIFWVSNFLGIIE